MASAKTKVCDVVSRLSAVTSNATREAWWMLSAAAGKSQHHLVQDAVEARNPIPELEIEIGKMLNPSQSENFDKMISDRIDARKPLQVRYCFSYLPCSSLSAIVPFVWSKPSRKR